MLNEESMRNLTFQVAVSSRWHEEVVEGLTAVLYGFQGPFGTQYHTLLPTTSSPRSFALGHSKVPKLSTRGYLQDEAMWLLVS